MDPAFARMVAGRDRKRHSSKITILSPVSGDAEAAITLPQMRESANAEMRKTRLEWFCHVGSNAEAKTLWEGSLNYTVESALFRCEELEKNHEPDCGKDCQKGQFFQQQVFFTGF